ncbi:MAG: hypothetical protein U0V56_02680 [Actinomycetota bacterium]
MHSGTLGWMPLSMLRGHGDLPGADRLPRLLRDGSIAAVVAYVLTFWGDLTGLRPVTGT